MYLSDYLVFILALLACMVFSMIAGGKVKSAYSAYSRVPCRSGLSGRETAERLLRMNGVYDIALGRVSGELTDHYAPNQSIVNLSTGTADSRSVAAAAVAAHEIGHVMQNKEGYGPYRVRTALVPVVNFGSRLAMPLVLIGILLDTYVRTANPDTGFYVAMVGVVLYGGSFLFSLVTLPVELDASRRAGGNAPRRGRDRGGRAARGQKCPLRRGAHVSRVAAHIVRVFPPLSSVRALRFRQARPAVIRTADRPSSVWKRGSFLPAVSFRAQFRSSVGAGLCSARRE